ncbi:hypothetical protein HK101_006383, partial [Irineochytrium annulatum]
MVQLYLRYRQAASFGVIASTSGNVAYDATGKIAVVPSLEDVACWDLKKGEKVGNWHDEDNKAEVSCICRSPNGEDFAVGYTDGSIRLWKFSDSTSTVTFTGHRSAITSLAFDARGHRLASGARDTELVIWDVLAETGLFRLRGHKDQITSIRFLEGGGCDHVVSAGKDAMVRFWDLKTQHCVETVIAHRGEVWGLEVMTGVSVGDDEGGEAKEGEGTTFTLITGGSEGDVRVWRVNGAMLAAKLEAATGAAAEDEDEAMAEVASAVAKDGTTSRRRAMQQIGVLERQSKERVVTIVAHPLGRYLGIQGADRLVEIYKLRTDSELRRRIARLKRRQREKAKVGEMEVDDDDDAAASLVNITAKELIPRVAAIRCVSKIRSFDLSPILKPKADDPT